MCHSFTDKNLNLHAPFCPFLSTLWTTLTAHIYLSTPLVYAVLCSSFNTIGKLWLFRCSSPLFSWCLFTLTYPLRKTHIELSQNIEWRSINLHLFLKICKLPTFSSKMLKKNKPDTHLRSRSPVTLALKVVGASLTLVAMVTTPIELFLFGTICHACSLPFGWFVYKQFAK